MISDSDDVDADPDFDPTAHAGLLIWGKRVSQRIMACKLVII